MSISCENKILPTDKKTMDLVLWKRSLHVLRKINIMVTNLVFGYTYSAFKVLEPVDDDGHG